MGCPFPRPGPDPDPSRPGTPASLPLRRHSTSVTGCRKGKGPGDRRVPGPKRFSLDLSLGRRKNAPGPSQDWGEALGPAAPRREPTDARASRWATHLRTSGRAPAGATGGSQRQTGGLESVSQRAILPSRRSRGRVRRRPRRRGRRAHVAAPGRRSVGARRRRGNARPAARHPPRPPARRGCGRGRRRLSPEAR